MKKEFSDQVIQIINKDSELLNEKDLPILSKFVREIHDLDKYINTAFLGCALEKHILDLYHLVKTLRLIQCHVTVIDEPKLSTDSFPAIFWLVINCRERNKEILDLALRKSKNAYLKKLDKNFYLLMSDEISDVVLIDLEIERIFFDNVSEKMKSTKIKGG